MREMFTAYCKKLIVFTIIFSTLGILIYFILPQNMHTPAFPYIFIFFFILTMSAHYIILKNTQNNPAKFIKWFMNASIIKLLIHISIMLLYALIFKTDAKNFILTYAVIYLFYTGFEIFILISDKSKTVKDS